MASYEAEHGVRTLHDARLMRSLLIDLPRDLRYGARMLRRSPGFATVAILSLALGIGGAASVFALVNAIVLRPLPIPNPDELFLAERHRADQVSTRFSWPLFQQARDGSRGRATLAAATRIVGMQLQPEGSSTPKRGNAQLVSGEYFELLQQQPQVGRLLTAADNQSAGAGRVAVLSDGYWRRDLGASPAAVGRTIAINGVPFTVAGVARPGFFGTTVALRSPDVWIPLMAQPDVHYAGNVSSYGSADTQKPWPPQAEIAWLDVFARASPPESATAIASVLTVLTQNDSRTISGTPANPRDDALPERIVLASAARGTSNLRNGIAAPLFVILAMVGVLLAIACGNVAGLLIARATAREREIAIRLSIGSGRARLVRQLLAESVLLAGVSGALGLGLAAWGRDLLLALFARGPGLTDLDASIDRRVLAFSVLVSLATGLACGMLPALRSTRLPLSESLKTEGRSQGIGGRRGLLVGKALVAAQMAFCVLLLVVAGLFIRSIRTLAQSDLGFDRDHLLVAELDVRSLGYSTGQQRVLYDRIVELVSAVPGVRSASFSLNGPLAGSAWTSSMSVEGHPARPGERLITNEEAVTERYFETVGLRLLEGRLFGPEDRTAGSRAAIINETMARRFFAGGSAVGKRFDYGESVGPDSFVIIGVVEDARYVDLRKDPPNMVYHLTTSLPDGGGALKDLEIRSSGSPAALVATIRRTLNEREPGLPIVDIQPFAERVDGNLSNERMIANLTSTFGALALALACLGLYGTVSYGINRRVAELGLRIALGANGRAVLWMVMREAMILVLLGGAVGLPLAFAAGRSVASLLYGVGPVDPVVYGVGAGVLLAVAVVAAYLPARRASRIEPMVALGRS